MARNCRQHLGAKSSLRQIAIKRTGPQSYSCVLGASFFRGAILRRMKGDLLGASFFRGAILRRMKGDVLGASFFRGAILRYSFVKA